MRTDANRSINITGGMATKEQFREVQVVISHGSSLSPFLLNAFSTPLFSSQAIEGELQYVSYVDDFALITCSQSCKASFREITRRAGQIQLLRKTKGYASVPPKSNSSLPREESKNPVNPPWTVTVQHQNNHNPTMGWLGVCFKENGKPSHHTEVRATSKAAKALAIFKPASRKRQSTASRAFNGLVIPNLSYGVRVWPGHNIIPPDLKPIQRVICPVSLGVRGAKYTIENHALCAEANIPSTHKLIETANLRALPSIHNLPAQQ